MNDWLRILMLCVMSALSLYALSGIDFAKITRRGHEQKVQILVLLLALALGYCVTALILGLSRYAII